MLQPKLTKVEPVKPLKLCLYYETGEVKLFDAAPYATGSWYGRLQDESYFATVHLLPGRYWHRVGRGAGYRPA